MATKAFMYKGICYSYPEQAPLLKSVLDSQFPMYFMNGNTLKAIEVQSSHITTAGRYVLSARDELAVVSGVNSQLLACDYDTQTFIPSNTNDLIFIIAMVLVFALGLSGGLQR